MWATQFIFSLGVRATRPSDPSKSREGSATRKFNPKGCATRQRLIAYFLTTPSAAKDEDYGLAALRANRTARRDRHAARTGG